MVDEHLKLLQINNFFLWGYYWNFLIIYKIIFSMIMNIISDPNTNLHAIREDTNIGELKSFLET